MTGGGQSRICIHPFRKLTFRVHGSLNLVCSAVATFLHVRLLSLAKCECGFLVVHGRLAMMFRHGRRMVWRHWIAGGFVLVGVDQGQS